MATKVTKLRVGFVPEHFSTPIHFAKQQFLQKNLDVELIPYPAGSGHLIQSLTEGSLDIAIGLTEAFIRGIANGNPSYNIIGTYVDSPLRWSVSTGYNRSNLTSVAQLQDSTIGVSRIGSGSYVMSFVLGLQQGFKEPFYKDFKVLSTFKNLRESVNEGSSDAFMWEYFTSKKYYDNEEIKQIGEIYTPWPSWIITARTEVVNADREQLAAFLDCIGAGISHFNSNHEEAIQYIYNNLDYSEEDAREWIKTVSFAQNVKSIDWEKVVNNTYKVLSTAGVLEKSEEEIKQSLQKLIFKLF